jgi:competence ComEA-like helix-hairpin-helix protein
METRGYQWRQAGRASAILVISSFFFGCTSAERSTQHVQDGPNISLNESININTANKDKLQRIPYIGEHLAEEIIEHREKHGPFRRAEHLILLPGFTDRRFREIRHLVRVD